MAILRDRYHDVDNKVTSSSSCLWLIESALKEAKDNNLAIDFNKLISLINSSINDLEEVESGLKFVKKIAYKVCDKNKDYDSLIFLTGTTRVLVTDNDISTIGVLSNHFSSMDETKAAKIFYATNLQEILDLLESENPTLMFLDIDIDNPTSSIAILKKFGNRIKTVVLSSSDKYKEECLDNGALTFIMKPLQNKVYIQLMVEHS